MSCSTHFHTTTCWNQAIMVIAPVKAESMHDVRIIQIFYHCHMEILIVSPKATSLWHIPTLLFMKALRQRRISSWSFECNWSGLWRTVKIKMAFHWDAPASTTKLLHLQVCRAINMNVWKIWSGGLLPNVIAYKW